MILQKLMIPVLAQPVGAYLYSVLIVLSCLI